MLRQILIVSVLTAGQFIFPDPSCCPPGPIDPGEGGSVVGPDGVEVSFQPNALYEPTSFTIEETGAVPVGATAVSPVYLIEPNSFLMSQDARYIVPIDEGLLGPGDRDNLKLFTSDSPDGPWYYQNVTIDDVANTIGAGSLVVRPYFFAGIKSPPPEDCNPTCDFANGYDCFNDMCLKACCLTQSCSPTDTIVFPDPAVDAAIRSITGSVGDITIDEVDEINFIAALGVSTLAGTECLYSLEALSSSGGGIDNLVPLSTLDSLFAVTLDNNNISDTSQLADLENLNFVDLDENSLSGDAALDGLPPLTYDSGLLRLYNNGINDQGFAALTDVSGVADLDISNNNITDLTPIGGYTSLWALRARNNRIDNIDALSSMVWQDSAAIFLSGNNISDLTSVIQAGFQVAGGGQIGYIDLNGNPIATSPDCQQQRDDLDQLVHTVDLRCQDDCGNGSLEYWEECDGGLFNQEYGESCFDFDYFGGSLSCVDCKIDKSGCDYFMRSIHTAGYWGTNKEFYERVPGDVVVPQDYIDFLNYLNVDWVGITVLLKINHMRDCTVEREVKGDPGIPDCSGCLYSIGDDQLYNFVHKLVHDEGFNVHIAIALEESALSTPAGEVRFHTGQDSRRWWIGCEKFAPGFIPSGQWPWLPEYSGTSDPACGVGHEDFVREFWRTYTQEVVHYARIAQNAGARMFALGGESDNLLTYWHEEELRTMVEEVRKPQAEGGAGFSGYVTYEFLHGSIDYTVLEDPNTSVPGYEFLFNKKPFDLSPVGISAYPDLAFHAGLLGNPTDFLNNQNQLSWIEEYDLMFTDPNIEQALAKLGGFGKPIVLLETGYTDTVNSIGTGQWGPVGTGDHDFGNARYPLDPGDDLNGNNIHDGVETQRNIYHSMLNVIEHTPIPVKGAFLWDNWLTDDAHWTSSGWSNMINPSIYGEDKDVVQYSVSFWYGQ